MTRAQRIRQVMGDGKVWSVSALRDALGLAACGLYDYNHLTNSLSEMRKRGQLVRLDKGQYRLTSEGMAIKERDAVLLGAEVGAPAPNLPGPAPTKAQERMWLVMRNLPQWSAADVERLSDQPPQVVAAYVTDLEAGGIVQRISEIEGASVYQVLESQITAPAGRLPAWISEARRFLEELIDHLCSGADIDGVMNSWSKLTGIIGEQISRVCREFRERLDPP
jgi:hypothetical protein